MIKLTAKLFILTLLLTACAPVTMEPPEASNGDSYPNPSYPSPSYPNDDLSADGTPAQQAALTHLSTTLNLPAGQINLISTEAVTWPDGCLGVQRPGVICTQALVEGFRIVFEANGTEYELHTNETGSAVVIANGLEVNSLIEVVLTKQLADNLGLDAETVSVVSNEPAEFGNTCLGVMMQDVMCAEVITPGRIVILESDGVRYEYHISDDGRIIQPATLALTWQREGGIAGFCNSLTVFLSGEIYGNQCKSQPNRVMSNFATLLSPAEQDQFGAWIEEYGSVTLDASDPEGVSDRMTLSLVLYGRGAGKPSQDVEGELFSWAQNLHGKLYE